MQCYPVLLALLLSVLFVQEAGSSILRSRRASLATGTTPSWAVSSGKKTEDDKAGTSSTSTTAAASPYTVADNTDDSTDDGTNDSTDDSTNDATTAKSATAKPAASSKTAAQPVQAVTVMITDANGTVSNFLTNATMVIATKNETGSGSKGAKTTTSSLAKTSDVKSSVANTTGTNATGSETTGANVTSTNSTGNSGASLDSSAPTQAPTNTTYQFLPPEGEEPRHWPVVVAGLFIVLALALCIRTAWRQSKRRDYEVVESLVV